MRSRRVYARGGNLACVTFMVAIQLATIPWSLSFTDLFVEG